MKSIFRVLMPLSVIALLGAGCLSPATPAPAPAPAPAPSAPEGALKTNKGYTDRLRNVVLVGAQEGNKISSPLLITGEARLWYFEASFPVTLTDAYGRIIAQAPAQADDDWMTEDWVPFTAELMFPPQAPGSRGVLVFKADNPSGLPEHDDSVSISVTF